MGLPSALVVAILGALTVLAVYLPIRHQQVRDHSAPALEMPSMHMFHVAHFWAMPIVQAAGFAALAWAYLGLMLGLLEAGGAGRRRWLPLSSAVRLRLHRHISLLVIGLILVHALATAFDAMGDNLLTAFVPFQEGYAPARLAFDVGIFALYLSILVGPTYYVRRWVGPRRWRIVHRLAAVVYVLALWHTLIIGDDVALDGWLHPLIWLLQIPLLLLLAVRLRDQARRLRGRLTAPAPVRGGVLALSGTGVLAVAAALGVVVLVATGSYGLIVQANPF